MRFLGVDPEKGNRLEWCCEEAHKAYLDRALDYEAAVDRFCIYGIPPFDQRDRLPRYLHGIDFCPFCSAVCEIAGKTD